MKIESLQKTLFTFFILLFFGVSFMVFAENSQESSENIFNDFDQDGLSNEEETIYGTDPNNPDTDGDGYSDFAEINSGYDPLKPAPGDKIITAPEGGEALAQGGASENLTETASLQIAGILADANNASTNGDVAVTMDNVQSVVEDILSQSLDEVNLPEVDRDDIKIKNQKKYKQYSDEKEQRKLKEDAEEYISALSYIIASNELLGSVERDNARSFFSSLISQASSSYMMGGYSLIENMSDSAEVALEQMNDLEVPENMLDVHVKGLQIVLYALELQEEARPDMQDPLSNMVALSKAQAFLMVVGDFMQETESKLSGLGIEYDIIQ